MFRIFAHKSKNNVPAAAIMLQVFIASLLLCTQTFEAVLEFIQFSLIFCSFLAVVGVVKLRYTAPLLPRPYRAWGYPVTPLIFLSVTLYMMYYLVTNRPVQSLAGFLMMLVGLVIYGIAQVRAPQVQVQQATLSK
jgi:APA family basic amino acid/polyamine antiporter